MKKIIYYHSIIVLLFSPLLLIGCSNGDELTRAKATELILMDNDFPREKFTPISLGTVQTGALSKQYDLFAPELNKSELGRAKMIVKSPRVYEIELTEKGSKFVRNKEKNMGSNFVLDQVLGKGKYERYKASIVTYEVSFGEITGITYLNEQQTIAQVEYTEIYEPTPFASLKIPGGWIEKKIDSMSVKAKFQLYDNGWRKI